MYNTGLTVERVPVAHSNEDSQSMAVSDATTCTEPGDTDKTDKAHGSATASDSAQPNEKSTTGPGRTSEKRVVSPDGRIVLTEPEAYGSLGFSFPTWKKWWILSVIFAIQCSMNLNTSLYANVVPLLSEQFRISEQLPCALAPNYGTIVVARFLGGISSAGGSVTLGMVADMWTAEEQQFAVAFIVFSSVGGSVIGPIFGGLIEANLSCDALIFTFLESFGPVFKQWGFTTETMGAAFVSIAVGYVIAYISFIPWIWKQRKQLRKDPHSLQPEARLWWLLFTVPLEPLGLFGFAWTSLGPPHTPWIAPMIFAAMIAIANFSIYMATIDYMIQAYGPYAASATGGNGFARDFLAGIAALYATPLYTNLGSHSLEWASTLLGFLAILVAIPVYIFYWKGPQIRARSRFAQELVHRAERVGQEEHNMGVRAGNA
ncbi:hypothetical protein EVJ58_g5919 [Rhodofomes roseus]|uniref:Major facilitator superfamily (MFS) profile domain-containing protein n=1 Tax=Rhodofomes roseus TaxID=34475 RepID=A0A4Y9Y9G9_9APHY|nr:hypothetical protein EVJ58_g5919 [Rhodofomes roseus]